MHHLWPVDFWLFRHFVLLTPNYANCIWLVAFYYLLFKGFKSITRITYVVLTFFSPFLSVSIRYIHVGELSVQTAELSAGVTFDPIPLTSVNTPCGYSSLRHEDECYNSSLSPSPAGGQTDRVPLQKQHNPCLCMSSAQHQYICLRWKTKREGHRWWTIWKNSISVTYPKQTKVFFILEGS